MYTYCRIHNNEGVGVQDAHVKAVCGSSSRNPPQEMTSDMKFTDNLGATSYLHLQTELPLEFSQRNEQIYTYSSELLL